jgi:hypothetical protein
MTIRIFCNSAQNKLNKQHKSWLPPETVNKEWEDKKMMTCNQNTQWPKTSHDGGDDKEAKKAKQSEIQRQRVYFSVTSKAEANLNTELLKNSVST